MALSVFEEEKKMLTLKIKQSILCKSWSTSFDNLEVKKLSLLLKKNFEEVALAKLGRIYL